MSDDLVKRSIAELQDFVRCRCHPAYTGRGLHDPDCDCDSADAVKVVADRIEELEKQLRWALYERDATFKLMLIRAETAEAKLAKAVGALEKLDVGEGWAAQIARTTLAELTGEKT